MDAQVAQCEVRPAFVGVDVALAKRKRLPVVVCVVDGDHLIPLPLREASRVLPCLPGNECVTDLAVLAEVAAAVRAWLEDIERRYRLRVSRIALDAPSAPCREHLDRREAEQALEEAHVSYIATPTWAEFEEKIARARQHLQSGRPLSRLPSANQLWMLLGFDLFRELGGYYECLEVYPQAIVRQLGCAELHKSTRAGYSAQRDALAGQSGWAPAELDRALTTSSFGSRHDKLDAFMAAWVASLPGELRVAFGVPPDDCIWVPHARTRPTGGRREPADA